MNEISMTPKYKIPTAKPDSWKSDPSKPWISSTRPPRCLPNEPCPFLNSETNERGKDPPVPLEHAACVWVAFASLVMHVVRRGLRTLPLKDLCDHLQRASIRVVRSPYSVRQALSRDQNLVDDLVQDVAAAMLVAIQRGYLQGARAAIYRWIQVVGCRITRDKSKAAALSLLTGAYLSGSGRDDDAGAPELSPVAGLNGLPLAEANAPEEDFDIRTQLKEVLFSSVPANLTDVQQIVFTRWLEGASHQDVADELGVSVGAARLLLMRARRTLLA